MAPTLFANRTNLKPVKRATTGAFQTGVRTFNFGGQVVTLKPLPPQATKKFVPKQLMTASMWREMLKKIPPKPMKPKKEKERRASMKEVVLRMERVIRVATRDMLEDYCKEFAKEGVPKKDKPKKVKTRIHEGVHCPAKPLGGMSVGFKESARPCNITVSMSRFESYDQDFTLGSFANAAHDGIRSAFTARLDYNDPIDESKIVMPEKVFEEETVEANVNILCNYDGAFDDD